MPKLLYFENGRKLFLDLGGEPVVVGRAEECPLRLSGSDVSRRHCRIVRSGAGYSVQDLGSQNGTRVNGERVEERPLRPGDRIEVGSAVLYYDRTGHSAVDGEAGERSGGALDLTFHRSREIYGAGPDTVEDWRREREQLLRLSDVAMALAHETDLAALLERIMDAAVALSGAERGFVILFEGEQLEVKVSRNLRRETLSRPEFSVSRSVVQKVAVTGRSVCLSDASQAEGFEEAQSIVDLGLRSVLCVPLLLQGKTLGALYLDHCTKRGAFGPAEERVLRLFGSQAAVALDSAQLREKDRERARLEHEVSLASKIQKRLLPATAPRVHGLAVHGVTIPARAVTGDYFDYLPGRDPSVLDVIVADVAGKGLPAGLVMVLARGVLRSLAPRCDSPREVLAELHRLLKPDLDPKVFLSAVLARWNEKRRELRVAGAGGLPALVYRAARRSVEELATGGIVVGAPKDSITDLLAEKAIPLQAGDVVLLYSDGATEARDGKGVEFGREGLAKALAKHGRLGATELVGEILGEIQRHVRDEEPHDDLTLVALRRE